MTRNPVIAVIPVLIVARRPDVTVSRTRRLIEDSNRWRGDVSEKYNSSGGHGPEERSQH